MTIYKLKRFTGEDEQPTKSNKGATAAKIGLGVLGTAGAAAGGFAMARRGVFGAKAAFGSNKFLAKMGNKFNKQSWVDNAASMYGNVMRKRSEVDIINRATRKGKVLNEADIKNISKRAERNGKKFESIFKDQAANNFKTPTA